jgi:hypothetical protein
MGRAAQAGGARLGHPGPVLRGVCTLAAVAALAVAAWTTAGAAASGPPDAFSGAGSWVSVYDTPAWRNPERVIATLAARHVHTLYLETSNWKHADWLVQPQATGRFLDAAHAAGIAVVAWTLPSLSRPVADLRRVRAALRFRSPAGERFDGFALDVESTLVRSPGLRSRRAIALAAAVRRAAPAGLPLGAITIAPVGASPTYWPGYPFAGLARSVDVLLPMAYFTDRTHGVARVAAYTAANLRAIRRQVGDAVAIAPVGGEAHDASGAELAAFLRAAAACGVPGLSLWEYGETTPVQWAALAAARRPASSGAGC